jgi:transcription-repair coupling factor (superfamily II helicase)
LRYVARQAGLTDIMLQGNHIRFAPVDLPDSRQVRLQRLYPGAILKPAVSTMLVPVPKAAPGTRAGSGSTRAGTGQTVSLGAPPLRDRELLNWCEELIEAVLDGLVAAQSAEAAASGSAPDGQAAGGSPS